LIRLKRSDEEKMETTLYASKVFDNQRWNVDQGLTSSKIFYSNQTHKQANTLDLQCRREEMKSNSSSLTFLGVDEDETKACIRVPRMFKSHV
jgi:hypothetical protein